MHYIIQLSTSLILLTENETERLFRMLYLNRSTFSKVQPIRLDLPLR